MTVIAGTDLEVNIEAYHSTPAARQYGDLKYGDDLYGAGAGQGPPGLQPGNRGHLQDPPLTWRLDFASA